MPAGMGKIYFVPKDKLLLPDGSINESQLQEVDLGKAPNGMTNGMLTYKDEDEDQVADSNDKGWSVTGTGTITTDKGERANLHKLLFGDRRLPRKTKKRLLNSILRNPKRYLMVITVAVTQPIMFDSFVATMLFPHRLKDNAITLRPAERRLLSICKRRIANISKRTTQRLKAYAEKLMAEHEAKTKEEKGGEE